MTSEVHGPVWSLAQWRERLRSGPFLLLVSCTLVLLLLRIHLFVWGDTWFNLVLGRQVAESGVITADRTTAVGWGTPVLDVQWLAHFLFYRTTQLVGFTGLVIAGATIVVCSVIAGAAMAIRAGATPGRVLLAALIAFMAMGAQVVLRAQTLAYPFLVLFPAVLWWDARVPRRSTWLLVPAAALWANLHGSVLLAPIFGGALLVARLLDAWRASRPMDRALAMRDGALTMLLAASILVTPYGLDVWHYYAQTAGNPVFRDYITEWFPLWSSPEIGQVALLLIVMIALVYGWRKTDSFTGLVLSGLCAMLITSVRHATPLSLACVVLLPCLLDCALGDLYPLEFRELSPRIAAVATGGAFLGFLAGVPWIAGEDNHRPGRGSLEQRIVAESGRRCLLIDEQQADRLMWYFPELTGRISHSVRVETIPLALLRRLGTSYAAPASTDARALWREYPVVAMDHRMHPDVIEVLSHDDQFELLGHDGPLFVFRNRQASTLRDACAGSRASTVSL